MAAALAFNPLRDSAPQVIAKGVGLVAENIIARAKESDIPVYVDERLVTKLNNVELGDSIPPEMYEIVAEVLVFISSVDKRASGKFSGSAKRVQ